jgi:hypothetical protein
VAGRGRWWPIAVGFVGAGVLAGAMVVLIVVLAGPGGTVLADSLASVVGGLLGLAGALVAVTGWAVRRRRVVDLPITAEQVDQAAATLAGAVREQWTREAQVRALGAPAPMPVRWRLASPTLMDLQGATDRRGGPLTFVGRSDHIDAVTAIFTGLPRRRLVITGGPGTGKTTLAVQLLLDLLPRPGEPPTQPVPVLLSLVGWNAATQSGIQEFLTAQLNLTYPALRAIHLDAAAALVEQGRVLPILDGLDEVAQERRAAIITALNTTLDPAGGVILTSRRSEYRSALDDAGHRLTGATVIIPYALSPGDVVGYLRQQLPHDPGPEWEQALWHIENGTAAALRTVTATPLGLWLLRTVYLDSLRDPAPLTDTFSTSSTLQAHLLEELIPAVVRARPPLPRRRHDSPEASLRPARHHRPDDLRRWLTTLAEQLPNGNRDWAWWELAPSTFSTYGARLATRTAVGLAVGLAYGIIAAPILKLISSIIREGANTSSALVGGSIFGLAGGFVAAFVVKPGGSNPKNAYTRLSGRVNELFKCLARGLLAGLVFGLAGGLVFGLAGWLVFRPHGLMSEITAEEAEDLSGWLFVGLVCGSLAGPAGGHAVGLVNFLSRGDVAQQATSPFRSYRGDRTVGLIAVLAVGLLVSLAVGLLFWLAAGWQALLVGLMFGLMIGIVVGPLCGFARSAWFSFVVAAVRQARGRRWPPPWRVMPTLDDCLRLGLLRTVGPVYQFRHAALQDHLAPPLPTPPT